MSGLVLNMTVLYLNMNKKKPKYDCICPKYEWKVLNMTRVILDMTGFVATFQRSLPFQMSVLERLVASQL